MNITYAFIDSQNLNLGILSQGWKLDFARFRVYLTEKYNISKAFLFIGYIEKNKELYKFLKKLGYTLVFKPTVIHKGETKGNVDAELVLWASAEEFKNYNKAIIVAGDGDYRCLIQFLKKKNKMGRLLIPNRYKYSRLLFEYSSDIDFLTSLKNKLGKK